MASLTGGTTFRGKVPIADGVEAFLFDKNGQGIIALWDRAGGGETRTLSLNLGERPVCVDLWGNVTPLFRTAEHRRDGRVPLKIGPTPIFLVDVDGEMAQLRASVALDRPLLESSFEPHLRRLRSARVTLIGLGALGCVQAAYLARAGASILASVGCYQLEHLGVTLFERIEGDYFTILGLPLLPLLADLRSAGLDGI